MVLLPDGAGPVIVVTDGGSENGPVVDDEFGNLLRRVCAQVDVTFSNSMIENLWHQAKHRWPYLHELDSVETLRELFGKFIEDHNHLIPRVTLRGRTPDEVFGHAVDLPGRLAGARAQARVDRVRHNQALASCGTCDGPVAPHPGE